MNNEKEFLLNELREHTEDCDCARNQHFYDEKKCRKKAQMFDKIKSIVFLITIATYILIVSGIKQGIFLTYLGIILSLASTLLEILSYMLRYDDEAMEHWKSAQMYSELYRKCQFFYSNYIDSDIMIWREKLTDISEELSRISLLSPSVSSKSFDDWLEHKDEKKYPVYKAIYDLKTDRISEVIDTIKHELQDKKIEIFLFGSYLTKMFYNDIDIAVIIHEEEKGLDLEEKMKKIEQNYSISGLDLDISVITEADVIANRCTQFIVNVCNGECYYKSPTIRKSIKEEYAGILTDYSEMIDYFINQTNNNKNDYASYISTAFYVYYHTLAALLSHEKVAWYGEKSLIINAEYYASNNDCKKKFDIDSSRVIELLQHARLFFSKKETVYLSERNNEKLRENDIKKLINCFNADIDIIEKIKTKLC